MDEIIKLAKITVLRDVEIEMLTGSSIKEAIKDLETKYGHSN